MFLHDIWFTREITPMQYQSSKSYRNIERRDDWLTDWLTDVNSHWHTKCARHAAHNPKWENLVWTTNGNGSQRKLFWEYSNGQKHWMEPHSRTFNLLAPARCGSNFKHVIFNVILQIHNLEPFMWNSFQVSGIQLHWWQIEIISGNSFSIETLANVDPLLWNNMVSPGQNK